MGTSYILCHIGINRTEKLQYSTAVPVSVPPAGMVDPLWYCHTLGLEMSEKAFAFFDQEIPK